MLRRLKIADEKGSGESKLFVGSASNSQQYDNFFNDFDPANTYQLKKDNLLDYLKYAWFEYVAHKCNKYKEIDSEYHMEKVQQVSDMGELISLKIVPHIDKVIGITYEQMKPIKIKKTILIILLGELRYPKSAML